MEVSRDYYAILERRPSWAEVVVARFVLPELYVIGALLPYFIERCRCDYKINIDSKCRGWSSSSHMGNSKSHDDTTDEAAALGNGMRVRLSAP